MNTLYYFDQFQTRLGTVIVQTSDLGLTGVWFETQTTQPTDLGKHNSQHPHIIKAKQQLQEYFSKQRTSFDLDLAPEGTEFQKQVWSELTRIPFGESRSYADLALAIGNPKAVRAVGLANGKNPISIIVPCHRVIGKSGRLTGYAGGLERKQKLLELECIPFKI